MLVEPEIAPLAKRLAEENNVNWRALTGSGANGRILERDVLEYLARVMAGEEDINPTAEPLPEGLDAWPEDDVKTYYGVDTSAEAPDFAPDIDDASLFVDSADSAVDPLGDDIFLVDEGDLSVAPVAHHEPVVYDSSSDNLDDDVTDVYGALTLDDMGVDSASDDVFETAQDALESFEEPIDEGLGDINIEAFGDTEPFVESEPFVAAHHSADQNVSSTDVLFVEEVEPLEDAFASFVTESDQDSFEDLPVMEALEPVEAESSETDYATFETIPTTEILEPIAEASPEDSESVYTYDAKTGDDFAAVQTQNVYIDDLALEEPIPAQQIWSEQSQDTLVEQVAFDETMPAVAEPESIPAWSEPAHAPVAESITPVATLAAGVALGAIQNAGDSLQTSALPLVTYGILLRRHLDLSTLIQAQHAVSEEVGHEDAQILTCLLLRAASKALLKLPLVQGSVGLASIHEHGVGITEITEASSASFRSILNKTHHALSGSLQHDSVALAVADMSGFDIDEAVLNVGVPVLTLGRMMYDHGKGTHHSTLSISGNVSVESGTKFLSAVAELLNSPVRLVV